VLYLLTSVSVVVYFGRDRAGEPVWNTLISPIVAGVLMIAGISVAVAKFRNAQRRLAGNRDRPPRQHRCGVRRRCRRRDPAPPTTICHVVNRNPDLPCEAPKSRARGAHAWENIVIFLYSRYRSDSLKLDRRQHGQSQQTPAPYPPSSTPCQEADTTARRTETGGSRDTADPCDRRQVLLTGVHDEHEGGVDREHVGA
jgi:hypothetical protein